VSERVTRSRELVAAGFAVAAVARVMQITRQAIYRIPKPRTAPDRCPPADEVEAAIVAEANGVDAGGGGIAGAGVLARNSIIARNTDQNSAASADCFITTGGNDHNVVGLGTGCAQGAGNIATAHPRLGKLGAHGGPTPTIPLLRGSPAIGAASRASAPRLDQRGVRRDRHPDSGAFERG